MKSTSGQIRLFAGENSNGEYEQDEDIEETSDTETSERRTLMHNYLNNDNNKEKSEKKLQNIWRCFSTFRFLGIGITIIVFVFIIRMIHTNAEHADHDNLDNLNIPVPTAAAVAGADLPHICSNWDKLRVPGMRNPCNDSSVCVAHHNESILEQGWGDFQRQINAAGGFINDLRSPCWEDAKESRCLPSLYLAGFRKCGTTTMADLLAHDPLINLGKKYNGKRIKESHWLTTSDGEQTWSRYTDVYKLIASDVIEQKWISLDASAGTIWERGLQNKRRLEHLLVPEAIAWLTPKSKFVIMVREPVSQIISSYEYFSYGNLTTSAFDNFILGQMSSFHNCTRDMHLVQCVYNSQTMSTAKTVVIPLYAVYIAVYARYFPPEQMMVIKMEDMSEFTTMIAPALFDFIGTSYVPKSDNVPVGNSQTHRKHYLSNDTKLVMESFYRPYNDALAQILAPDESKLAYTPTIHVSYNEMYTSDDSCDGSASSTHREMPVMLVTLVLSLAVHMHW